MNTNLKRPWWNKLIALLLISTLALTVKIDAHAKTGTALNTLDTLDRVSMIFHVGHGVLNSLNINNHPVLKSSYDTFLFSTTSDLPEGLELLPEGKVTWSPTAEQFTKLDKQPIVLEFTARSLSNTYVLGTIRILAEGVLMVDESVEPNATAGAAAAATIEEESQTSQNEVQFEPISIKLPQNSAWDARNEGEDFYFELSATGGSGDYKFEVLEPEFLMENLDQYGAFAWSPDYDVVSTEENMRAINLMVKAFDTEGNEAFASVAIYVQHVNRPPVVDELPTFYIQFNALNTYQLKKDGLAFDPDGDSIIFRPVLKELPQGMKMNKNGEISWKPSRSQFNYLRANPMYLSFTVEDYPAMDKTIGQIKIEVSQADLPPQITMIPNKEAFEIKENEELEINFFITDPNGQNDLLSFDFVSENGELKDDAMFKKGDGQYEFKWTPGYDFIIKQGEKEQFDISFFAIDKESNRTEKNILVTVEDTEDLVEKDRVLYDQYRTVLERAWDMITQLNEREKELEKEYKHAKKGKKNRAISTASLGALTGLSPIIFMDNPEGQNIAAGLGGTATATIGTLEASNVIGEPPSDIMRDLNYVTQKRNDLLVYGNVFASKYALPLSKRDRAFQSDLRSLSIHLNLKDMAKLELDATWENSKQATAKNLKRVFKDFNSDPRFEGNYK